MNKNLRNLALSVITAASLASCSTDFELNAPYDDVPIVYGLLDQSTDTNWIKINKTFAGTGNNVDYAAINDSSMYDNLSGVVEEWIAGVNTKTYNVQEMWVQDIEAGIFYTDSQKVYFIDTMTQGGLNSDATYKLIVDVSETGKTVEAETALVSSFGFSTQFTNMVAPGVNFAYSNSSSSNNYPTLTPTWQSATYGKRYEFALHFFYKEHIDNGIDTTVTMQEIVWNLGSQEAITADGGESMDQPISGDAFYSMVQSRLDGYAYEADVIKRIPDRLEFRLTVAGEDLHTYMEVNEPATGIVTDRPSYTNVAGGTGIFSSRYTTELMRIGSWPLLKKIKFNFNSTKELCEGQYTSGFKFCTDSADGGAGIWSNSTFHCN